MLAPCILRLGLPSLPALFLFVAVGVEAEATASADVHVGRDSNLIGFCIAGVVCSELQTLVLAISENIFWFYLMDRVAAIHWV